MGAAIPGPDGPAPGPGARARPVGPRVVRFLAAMAVLCGIASFAQSSAFDVQSVTVAGNEAVASDEIVARAGVRPGMSMFAVNVDRVQERLRGDQRLADVSVGVGFPDRVEISVREQTPAAALRVTDGYVLVGRDGVAIAARPVSGTLPILIVDRLDPAIVQVGVAVPSADVRLGAGIAASLPGDLRPDVASVRVDGGGEVVLYTRDGIAVRAGAPDGVQDRIARLVDVLAAIRARGMRVEYVDLRFPGSVIVKPIVKPAGASGLPQGALPAAGRQEKFS